MDGALFVCGGREMEITLDAVAHLATSMLFGEATWLPVRGGRLDLGTWQHVYLVELYEPRRREVDIAVLGT